MKKLFFATMFVGLFIQSPAQQQQQHFKLGFIGIEKFLTNKSTTIAQITAALKPTYELVSNKDGWAKYRDDSKSWEATISVEYDRSTKLITEIQFVAPKARVFEYMDELKDNLGFKWASSEKTFEGEAYDIYENPTKKLGAKIVPAEFLGEGLWLYRIYRLGLDK